MENDTASPRVGAARLRTVLVRMSALLAAAVSLAAIAPIAAGHGRRAGHGRLATGRHHHPVALRRAFARRRLTTIDVERSPLGHRGRTAPVRIRGASRRRVPRRPVGCPHSQTPIAAAQRAEMRRSVLCLVNRQRRQRGLPGLRASGRLDHSAQGWTNTMVEHRAFSHGASFSARISAAGFDWSDVGENIASGFRSPQSVVRAWMRSTGHCQNILNPMFREMGTGVAGASAMGGDGRRGTWTIDLGLGISQRQASRNWTPAERCPYPG